MPFILLLRVLILLLRIHSQGFLEKEGLGLNTKGGLRLKLSSKNINR